MNTIKSIFTVVSASAMLFGCGTVAPILSTPIESIDNTPIKISDLTTNEKQTWGHLDIVKDTIPGMSVDKAYAEIIKGKKGKTTIVAVIDSGIDIDHEDLDGVLWTNTKEIPNNGKDDDKNGYIDDIHGWNFLGKAYNEQLELTRIVAKGDTSIPRYAEAKAKYDKTRTEALQKKQQYEQIYNSLNEADKAFAKHFKKDDYTFADIDALETTDETLNKYKGAATQMKAFGIESIQAGVEELKGAVEHFTDQLNYNYNKDFNGRTTGDNPDDFNDKPGYGDGNVKPVKKSESHGTHVAGIVAAERNNGKGANGVANNVQIMSIRAVPNGDEYDKDIAKAIRYAVDNGAKVINGSFGKSFSQQSEWVRDAITYAAKNDVVFVHAAGNDGADIDVTPNFPDDNINGNEISDTYIRVGALAPKYGSEMVANFSNYGQNNVDVFAPGAQIYSATPQNEYKTYGGTSMAAPAVAGIAALIRSQYPKLKASQVKNIILQSGLPIPLKVVVGGDANNIKPFSTLSKSGKMANAYNALVLADRLSK